MKNKIIIGAAVSIAAIAFLSSCASIPKNAEAVQQFNVNRYLGAWYEVARFDYRFEKNLDNVAAQYSLNENGTIKVVNSGYNFKKYEWKSTKGEAKFKKNKNIAEIKVSFFKPFYSGYNVVAIDKDYKYALVAGRNLSYLWILSREKTIPEDIKKEYLAIAKKIGYDTSKLIWVKHNKTNPFLNER